MNTKLLPAIALAVALGGCSGTPSASDARQKLENQIQQESRGLIKLVSFEKTDGAMHEMMGMKGYVMSYTAEIEFLDDCVWSGSDKLSLLSGGFRAQRDPPPAGEQIDFFIHSEAKKGEHLRFTGQMNFAKTERGWN
jgi:hypothetical protein